MYEKEQQELVALHGRLELVETLLNVYGHLEFIGVAFPPHPPLVLVDEENLSGLIIDPIAVVHFAPHNVFFVELLFLKHGEFLYVFSASTNLTT